MRLFAISDLHLNHAENRAAVDELPPHPDDWLILGGDLAETHDLFIFALSTLSKKFAKLIWVPGNHELWTAPGRSSSLKGEAKYLSLVSICHDYGVLTPEDPYCTWVDAHGSYRVVPLFLLYDYSFRPSDVPLERAVDWAMESHIMCSDAIFLNPHPFESINSWCNTRCQESFARLQCLDRSMPLVLINHFPLREDLISLPKIPRFSIWCGTRETEDWHTVFNVSAVVSGHLHNRSTQWRDGVRFEEVSLGYPRQWDRARGLKYYLRQILPYPAF